ncbi:MAG: cation:proton antiporter [Phyllobacteriaceae bacterium]|nr:cation:proton antiporter [Phyllobacteriaceae bacterium]
MSASEHALEFASLLALGLLTLSFLITVWRVIKGPTLPDRVLALDMLVAVAIGFTAVIAVRTGFALYVDVAIALGLVGFLATVAFARFVLQRRRSQHDTDADADADAGNLQRKTGKDKPDDR